MMQYHLLVMVLAETQVQTRVLRVLLSVLTHTPQPLFSTTNSTVMLTLYLLIIILFTLSHFHIIVSHDMIDNLV